MAVALTEGYPPVSGVCPVLLPECEVGEMSDCPRRG